MGAVMHQDTHLYCLLVSPRLSSSLLLSHIFASVTHYCSRFLVLAVALMRVESKAQSYAQTRVLDQLDPVVFRVVVPLVLL